MLTARTLRKAMQRAIAAAVMTSPTLAACGEDPGIENDPDFVPMRCSAGQPEWLVGLEPDPPVDFLKLVGLSGAQETRGEACKTATVTAACEAGLAELAGMQPLSPALRIRTAVDHFYDAALHVTRGDEVFSVDSSSDLLSLLGEIDTPQEAMLLTQASSYNVECDGGGARPSVDGFEVQAYLGVGCGGLDRYLIAVRRDGSVERLDRTSIKKPKSGCVVGRRPAGLRSPVRSVCTSAGEYFARAATLEAASVEAFRRLAAELQAHGAPRSLIAAALRAARDEVRHARVTARLARRLGATAERPTIQAIPVREIEAIACENAIEGCVRETFGALEGRWQALHAADPGVRRAYRAIAEDELRHAALSWRVARWIEPRLGAAAKKRVSEARQSAVADLRVELAEESSPEIRQRCGVPCARDAQVLFASLSSSFG